MHSRFRYLIFAVLLLIAPPLFSQIYFEESFGELFEEVQTQPVFEDSKTFPDCVPLFPAEEIIKRYQASKNNVEFDLKEFVLKHFELPENKTAAYQSDSSLSIQGHIEALWEVLQREPDTQQGSLIPLPNPYIVPGGRFREIYYWDSYFTMLGLQVSGEVEIMQNMVDNFAYLIDKIGFIPNGNRTYYTSRSQPPFFTAMVKLLADTKADSTILLKYLPYIEKEYTFWMEGKDQLNPQNTAHRRVVRLPDGEILNRYWDDKNLPRTEAYKEDVLTAESSMYPPEEVYRHLRAAAESGWDFSSRWFRDGKTLSTIHTTEVIPVDLNALLYDMERTLAKIYALDKDTAKTRQYEQAAQVRQEAVIKYCWDPKKSFFTDYDFVSKSIKESYSLAGMYPLYFGLATPRQSRSVARFIEKKFLQSGGVLTTLTDTDQQWDAPNGWPPLQWITVKGLEDYGFEALARKISDQWTSNVNRVYKNTGKMVEKYNVTDITLEAGGGEYPNQDGFGWTNGVFLKLVESED
jgi:alpha,alpha-trehalase